MVAIRSSLVEEGAAVKRLRTLADPASGAPRAMDIGQKDEMARAVRTLDDRLLELNRFFPDLHVEEGPILAQARRRAQPGYDGERGQRNGGE